MGKPASLIRSQAESTAKRCHCSPAEKIQYWADLGRKVSRMLDPGVLLAITSGLTVIEAPSE